MANLTMRQVGGKFEHVIENINMMYHGKPLTKITFTAEARSQLKQGDKLRISGLEIPIDRVQYIDARKVNI